MDDFGKGRFYVALDEVFQAGDSEQAPLLEDLARRIFDLTPADEVADESISDVAGLVRSLWDYLAIFDGKTPKISCFNPSQEEDGWEHRHTQIFVLQRDMPFLVDSIRMALNRLRLGIHIINSTVLGVQRDDDGALRALAVSEDDRAGKEALIYLQVDRFTDPDEFGRVVAELAAVLGCLEAVTDDFQPMLDRLAAIIADVRRNPARLEAEVQAEYLAFLDWVHDNHFTFLAYSYGQLPDSGVQVGAEQGQLGLFRANGCDTASVQLSELASEFHDFHQGEQLLTLAKSPLRSRIHRDTYCEYLVIKDYDERGHMVGEHRFLGLYTSLVHSQSPFGIPLIREKLQRVIARSGLSMSSHDGKALRKIMESHPREELFHASEQQLFEILIGIWQIQERRRVRLFLRPDPYGEFVSCLLYLPRDSYRTEIREQAEALLKEQLDAVESQFTTYFTESLLVRTHFVLRVASDRYRQVDAGELERSISALTQDWRDELRTAIVDHWGAERGLVLAGKYREAFPVSYREHFVPRTAVHDLDLILGLEGDGNIAMRFYQPPNTDPSVMHFKIFHLREVLSLSAIVPMLENLGFLVIGEHPYRIAAEGEQLVMLHEFILRFTLDIAIDVPGVRNNFQEAFAAVWHRKVEDDSFNRLVVGARLDWRSVVVLRLYARYMKQLGLAISHDFIATTLSSNLDITRNLVALFKTRFDPKLATPDGARGERPQRLESKIIESLDKVANLNQDQVLRTYLQLILATVRTNFFQRDAEGEAKPYVSIKLMPRSIALLPEPRPEYEIFVYSPRMEGVHLRVGKVARGGIRWSGRAEDYRTEILGLVKAQEVKNAVIVPTGAKGGYVVKRLPSTAGRDEVQAEGVACYRMFITGLLDITDNVLSGQIVPPVDVVCHDGDDAYLVVAADKGTASFSDIANSISADHDFWLGDAFASGGSHGYDHKKIGITARGAWVAVRRHFRELGLNPDEDDFTVVGIGDMSGDVFGNGMLRSRHIRLVAAFNHQSIFLDPDPDPEASFEERKRLFDLPRSSWEDYDRARISRGGGVFSRAAKSIALSAELKALLAVDEDSLTPARLIHCLLKVEVDLVWNGGIGTYVKGSLQSDIEVGDRANDEVRVNGSELRCRVFGEGGNLGMTQQGRVEYSLNGGACNTDFIDNMGGVACSDQEVNIKILLNHLVANEDLTPKQRNLFLAEMTDEVAELVLGQSSRQILGISLARYRCENNLAEFWNCIVDWEAEGIINRKLTGLPDDDVLVDRQKKQQGLTRPELAVLASHSKLLLKGQLRGADVLDDEYLGQALLRAFPPAMTARYGEQMTQHPLKNDIIANQLTNEIVDRMGLSFVHRLMKSTGAAAGQVVRASTIVSDVLRLDEVWAELDGLNHQQAREQFALQARLMRLGRRATRWILRNRRNCTDTRGEIERFDPLLKEMLDTSIASCIDEPGESQSELGGYLAMGLTPYAAILMDSANDLFFAFGMADVSIRTGLSIDLVSETYGHLEEALSLNWFSDQIIDLTSDNRWEDFAKESFIDEMETLYRAMAVQILNDLDSTAQIEERIQHWRKSQAMLFERWQLMIRELRQSPQRNYAMFSVALRELQDLVDTLAA